MMFMVIFTEQEEAQRLTCTLTLPNGILWAIEIKRSMTPKLERGDHVACADLNPSRKIVVYPGKERYRLAPDIEAMSLVDIVQQLCDINKGMP
jgi:hypothetical protein